MSFIPNDINTEGMVKIRIEAIGGDLDRVACRYPVSFMNEMARQLTAAIESATGTTGIADSSVELILAFATTTYMEHISGNVTYRRLMLVDSVSAPRDFWIKWTRLDNCDEGYNESNILFELGEDVEQSIRQREYKYLLHSGGEKYHNSMGRKKVTEWREVIKRAARRGELSRIESDFELAPETLALEERIADLLGKRIAQREEAKAEVAFVAPEDDEFARAMEKARMIVESSDAEDKEDEEVVIDLSVEEAEPALEIASDGTDEAELEFVEEALELETEDSCDEEAEDEEASDEEDLIIEEEIIEEESDDESELEIDIFADDEPVSEVETVEVAIDSPIEEVTQSNEEPAVIEEIDIFADAEPADEGDLIEEWLTESSDLPELALDEEPVPVAFVAPEDENFEQTIEEAALFTESNEEPEDEALTEPEIEIEIIEEPYIEIVEEAPECEPADEVESVDEIVDCPDTEPDDADCCEEETISQGESIADRLADIRAQLETKIRLEYETRARIKAEEELASIRRELEKVKSESESIISELVKENERLRMEFEHLREATERDALAREAEVARRRAEEEQLRAQIEMQLRAEASERERLEEAARMAIEEQHRLEAENARIARQREEEERIEAERIRQIEEEKAIEEVRRAELERIRREDEAQRERAKNAMPDMGNGRYSYTSKIVKFLFRRSVDPNITSRIQEIIKATVDYYGKDNVYLKIRASVPDSQTVVLEFTNIPLEEMELLGNIIKIIGNSGLGIAKAIIE